MHDRLSYSRALDGDHQGTYLLLLTLPSRRHSLEHSSWHILDCNIDNELRVPNGRLPRIIMVT